MSKFEESRIQEAIVKRFNELVFYKQFNKLCFLYSNRNENKGIISGARYKKQGTKNSDLIDWKSDYWDPGYRRIATKLFLSRVFLPDLS